MWLSEPWAAPCKREQNQKKMWKSRLKYFSLAVPYVENICKIKTKHSVSKVSNKVVDPCEVTV